MDAYRHTLHSASSEVTLLDALPREVRDIALEYVYSKQSVSVLSDPITRQDYRWLLRASKKITVARFYAEGCRIDVWDQAVMPEEPLLDPMFLLNSYASASTVPPTHVYVLSREELASLLSSEGALLHGPSGNTLSVVSVFLDVGSMHRLFQHRTESFDPIALLPQRRTLKFLDDVIARYYHTETAAALALYLMGSVEAMGMDLPDDVITNQQIITATAEMLRRAISEVTNVTSTTRKYAAVAQYTTKVSVTAGASCYDHRLPAA